jgi:hypothetical protein
MRARNRADDLIDACIQALRRAREGHGYAFTYAGVWDWWVPGDAESPSLCVLAGDEHYGEKSAGFDEGSVLDRFLEITVEGRHVLLEQSDLRARVVASRMLADIERAMLADYTQGGAAISTTPRGSARRLHGGPGDELEVHVSVTFEIRYRTRYSEPTEI